MCYFERNNLFANEQHGFRENRSCETDLQSILDDYKKLIDDKEITLSLFVYFKKAFDLINPELLFRKLFHDGFNNDALYFFSDYLDNRKQVTVIDCSVSPSADLLFVYLKVQYLVFFSFCL